MVVSYGAYDNTVLAMPSGPPIYMFSECGRLVDWCPDSGDNGRFFQQWKGLKEFIRTWVVDTDSETVRKSNSVCSSTRTMPVFSARQDGVVGESGVVETGDHGRPFSRTVHLNCEKLGERDLFQLGSVSFNAGKNAATNELFSLPEMPDGVMADLSRISVLTNKDEIRRDSSDREDVVTDVRSQRSPEPGCLR